MSHFGIFEIIPAPPGVVGCYASGAVREMTCDALARMEGPSGDLGGCGDVCRFTSVRKGEAGDLRGTPGNDVLSCLGALWP